MKAVLCAAAALTLAACGSGWALGGDGPDGGAGGGGTGGGGQTTFIDGGYECTVIGLPPDCNSVLNNDCRSCHGATLAGGAPIHLVTYDDLVAQSSVDPSMNVAERCVSRMQSTSSPMPPGAPGMVPAADIATLQNWISSGSPAAVECHLLGTDAGVYDAGFDPFSVTQCTSMSYYSHGESAAMEPGNACIACHQQSGGEAPLYFAAGTVYPTGHEPSRCNGAHVTGATVVFTDANGGTHTAPVNAYGNFSLTAAMAQPFHVKVVFNGMERAMSASPTTGDCNSCHTATGALNAPGRIVLPAP